MLCTAAGEGLVAGLVWTECAAEEEAEEGIVDKARRLAADGGHWFLEAHAH
jgi:hypothetical protein